jgi:hypothetical protein
MSARRARPRRRVRTTENVVQEEDPDNPRVIYRALRTACLGTLLKWDSKLCLKGGDSSEGYLREPVGPLVIGFDTMLCVCPAGYKVSQKLRVKAGWLTGVDPAGSLPADHKFVKKWQKTAEAAAGAAAEAVVQSPVRPWGAASVADLRSPVPGSPAGHGAPVPSSVRKSPIQVTESDLPVLRTTRSAVASNRRGGMTNDALLAEARSVVCLVEPGDKKAMLTEHAEIATSDRGVTENRDHFFCCVDTARTTGSKLCVSNRRVATRANFQDADIIEVAGAGDRTMPRAWNNDQPLQVGGRAQKEVHKCTEFIRSKTYLIQQSLRHGDVVVCCWNGRSRSPTVVAAWLIEYRGLSLACAKAFMEDAFQIQRPRLSKTAGSSVPNLSKFDLSLAELIPAMHLQDNVTEHDVTEQQGNEIDTDDEVPASDVGSPSSDQSGATQMYTPNSVALNGASHEMMYGPLVIGFDTMLCVCPGFVSKNKSVLS